MSVKALLNARWQRWLDKRIPKQAQIQLGHKSIFILPSRSGWMYLLLLLVLIATGINYQNSLIYALCFWLFSLSLVAMIFTFRNVSGLQIQALKPQSCFVNERLELPLVLKSERRFHESLRLSLNGSASVEYSLPPETTQTLYLSYLALKRGPLNIERIRLDSQYPLGIFRVWSWLKFDFNGVVFPQPEFVPFQFAGADDGQELQGAPAVDAGQNDFYGLRAYQAGDSLKRIAWKQYARGKGLVTKEFDHDNAASCMLSWDSLAPLPIETRLSRLCGWVLTAHENGWNYGLSIPGKTIEPSHSVDHKERCLMALALFGYEGRL